MPSDLLALFFHKLVHLICIILGEIVHKVMERKLLISISINNAEENLLVNYMVFWNKFEFSQ